MKTVILAGGLGTRLQEETSIKPKPMVEIGGMPVLWHIMKIYAYFGHKEFVLALGYKGEIIKDYFLNYHLRSSSVTVNLTTNEIIVRRARSEEWIVHLLDTGVDTQTGGRVKQAAEFIGNEPFMLTYGDGVANVDINALLGFHQLHRKIATVTAVRPPARFGGLQLEGDLIINFVEKPQVGEGWINGGFFVFQPEIKSYIQNNQSILEREPLESLAAKSQLRGYRHEGFWQCMDTMRDVRLLEEYWQKGSALWKIWE